MQQRSPPLAPPITSLPQGNPNAISQILDIMSNAKDDLLNTIEAEPHIFGIPTMLMVLKEDIQQFLEQEEIGVYPIMIYMRYD